MKKILLFLCLMIHFIGISQVISTNNDLDIYKGLVNGDNCRLVELPANKQAVISLNSIIHTQNDSIQLYSSKEKDLNAQISKLNIDKENAAMDILNLQNQVVPWYLSKWTWAAAAAIIVKLFL